MMERTARRRRLTVDWVREFSGWRFGVGLWRSSWGPHLMIWLGPGQVVIAWTWER